MANPEAYKTMQKKRRIHDGIIARVAAAAETKRKKARLEAEDEEATRAPKLAAIATTTKLGNLDQEVIRPLPRSLLIFAWLGCVGSVVDAWPPCITYNVPACWDWDLSVRNSSDGVESRCGRC